MGRKAIAWTPERRREHGRRSVEGKRAAEHRRRMLISHVDDYRRTGAVHPSMQPLVEAHVRQGQDYVADLGGYEHVTSMQLALVDLAVQAGVIRDANFALVVRNGMPTARAAERFQGAANVERAALAMLGLERVAKPVKGLDLDQLRQRIERPVTLEAQPVAAQDRPGSTISSEPDSKPAPPGNCTQEPGS